MSRSQMNIESSHFNGEDVILKALSLFIVVGMAGFLWGVALLSIGYFLISGLAVYYFFQSRKVEKRQRSLFKDLEVMKYSSFLIIPSVLGMLLSENTEKALHIFVIMAPLLVMPFAFSVLPKLRRKDLTLIIFTFSILLLINSSIILLEELSNVKFLIKKISTGKSFETPIHHIRYTLLISLCSWTLLYIAYTEERSKFRNIFIFLGVFFALILHVFAVKTGLLSWYIIAFVFIALQILKKGFNKYTMASVLAIVLLPLLAYSLSSTLRSKINYTIYDLQHVSESEGINYSDSKRIYALGIAWDIFLENPVLGVGSGDFDKIQLDRFERAYPETFPILPHMDWITILASTGVIGLMVFGFSFFSFFFKQKLLQHPLLIVVFVINFVGTLVDNHFLTAAGVALYTYSTMIVSSCLIGGDLDVEVSV